MDSWKQWWVNAARMLKRRRLLWQHRGLTTEDALVHTLPRVAFYLGLAAGLLSTCVAAVMAMAAPEGGRQADGRW